MRIRTGALSLTFPQIPPCVGARDYRVSKKEETNIKYSRKWEEARDSAEVRLVDAQKKQRDMTVLLQKYRQETIVKRKQFDKKWAELGQKEETFKMMFKKFNTFVRENQEKRDRAEKKISEEIALQEKRTSDIEIMEKDYRFITSIRHLMEKKNKEHKMYEDYLQAVVKSSNAHKNVNDVLYRYESLLETRGLLSEKQQKDLAALETAQSNLMKLLEDKTLTLVGLQNQLASLQERYELAYNKSLQWEATVSKIQDIYNIEISKIHSVKCSIDYTYLEMCKRKQKAPVLPPDDYEAKLCFIKETLVEICKVLGKLKPSLKCRNVGHFLENLQ